MKILKTGDRKLRYLITGVNGFVGRYFAEYLQSQEENAEILGVDITENSLNNIKYKQVDLKDKSLVYKLLEEFKPDYIVHLAAMSSVAQSWREPAACFINNTSVFLNIADSVNELNLKCRILSVGSSEEYGIYDEAIKEDFVLHPKSPYSVARLSQEYLSKLYVDNYGLDIVMTRSFNHIGPRQNPKFVIPSFVEQLVNISRGKQDNIKTGNLDVVRDFLDVRDVVSAYYKILKESKNRSVYNVCSGKGVKLSQIIDIISDELKITPEIIIDKDKIRPNEIMYVVGDNTKIKTDLGWKPKYELHDTIKDMIEFLQKNSKMKV